ncbi:MAG: PAS domain S-box protein, partial [Kiritimatiellaeota bacterium]|nr:PAS domain S-box protein [Kiritimatiellota bacterium]
GSNELLALFIKHSPIFAYIKDVSPTESRVLTASENFQDMIGIPGSAMAGKTMADLFPADFAAKMTADDWAVVSSGKLLVQDEELNGRNYTTIKFPLFVGGRKLLAGYTIDITEQKRAAEALRVSETMLNETGRMAKIGGWAIDLVKNTLTWTREVYAIHEVADDFQPSIADAINFYAPESRPVIQQAVERAIQTGEPYDVELELITAKQHRIWVQAIGHALLVAGKAQLVSGTFQDITERKRAEEKLRASEERYRLLHESMMDAFVSVNMDGRIVEFNLVYQAMLGYTAEELRQLIYTDLTPEKWHTMEAKLVTEQIIPRGFSDVYEKEYRRKDGTIFPVELRTYLLRDEQGSPKGMWAIVRDITERKRVELALQESEEKYRIFVQYTRIAVVAHGPDTAVLFSNPMAAQLLGLTSDQMRGKTAIDPAWSFIRENGTRMPLSEYPINRAVASNTPITNLVLGILRPDRAGPTWVQCDTHTIRDPAGQLKQIVVTFFDITERKLALEAQVRLSTAIEQAAETIEITDAAGTILYVNPAFEKTTGYTRAEVLGQNPRMLKSGKHNAEFYLWMWAVLSAGQIWKGRLINKRKNGTFFEEEASIAPVRDAAGQIINYVAVKRDITHEVALEEQHRQAVKLEAVGRLAGGVAHDFNNKLQIILSSVEMILADLQPDHLCRADILEIQKAAQRSSDLTRQLLAFSRQQTITPVLLDVNGTISQSLKMLSRLIGENIHLRFVQKPDAGRVFIDPSQVDQILANLAVNARDAIVGTGHITIEVGPCTLQEADCQDKTDFVPPGDYVVLTFRDDGAGMTPEIQKH